MNQTHTFTKPFGVIKEEWSTQGITLYNSATAANVIKVLVNLIIPREICGMTYKWNLISTVGKWGVFPTHLGPPQVGHGGMVTSFLLFPLAFQSAYNQCVHAFIQTNTTHVHMSVHPLSCYAAGQATVGINLCGKHATVGAMVTIVCRIPTDDGDLASTRDRPNWISGSISTTGEMVSFDKSTPAQLFG